MDAWACIEKELRNNSRHHEPVVFALTTSATVADRELILVRDVIVPPESAFLRNFSHGAQWSARYNIELLDRCVTSQSGLLVLHSHGSSHTRMSGDDLQSAKTMLPLFQRQVPGRAHASVVLGERAVDGVVWLPHRNDPISSFELRVFAGAMTTLPLLAADPRDMVLHEKQALVVTRLTREMFARARIAFVGLSGGGSQVVTHVAAYGAGELILIDNQCIDEGNRHSTDAFTSLDALSRRSKIAAMKKRIRAINRTCRVTCVPDLVPGQRALEALKSADVIVGCVNNLAARADILEIAGRYCIPYVDIGLTVRTSNGVLGPAPIVAISGNTFTNLPGGACLWCSGYLTKEKLETEAGGADRSYMRTAKKSGDSREVLVAPFNGVLASTAACDVLQLILGFSSAAVVSRKYDGLTGAITEWEVPRRKDCPHCLGVVANGDPVWH
jgi:hypothetical protein